MKRSRINFGKQSRDNRDNAIVALRDAGITYKLIGEQFGLSASRVAAIYAELKAEKEEKVKSTKQWAKECLLKASKNYSTPAIIQSAVHGINCQIVNMYDGKELRELLEYVDNTASEILLSRGYSDNRVKVSHNQALAVAEAKETARPKIIKKNAKCHLKKGYNSTDYYFYRRQKAEADAKDWLKRRDKATAEEKSEMKEYFEVLRRTYRLGKMLRELGIKD